MYLLVGDTHFTDKASESYRFDLFPWIRQQQAKKPVAATYLLGDITENKDRHSAALVNQIVSGLVSLRPPVYIVRGNHDYRADQTSPFFDFLNHIDGLTFAVEPMSVSGVMLIPHYRTQEEFDDAIRRTRRNDTNCLLCHQTFEGAIAESGIRLSGLRPSLVESMRLPLGVYAGDVHRPQTQGKVTYVGCPYQVRFGDNFEPRCLWLAEDGKTTDLYFDAPRKWSLTVREADDILSNQELFEGDQVKLTIQLGREEAVDWKKIRQEVLAACKSLKLDVFGVTVEVASASAHKNKGTGLSRNPCVIFDQFCKVENVASNIRKIGERLLSENTEGQGG